LNGSVYGWIQSYSPAFSEAVPLDCHKIQYFSEAEGGRRRVARPQSVTQQSEAMQQT
tara:strand:- start:121 stop:291 length:171 start_codon:yes stop_codon:yes gene_type:complete